MLGKNWVEAFRKRNPGLSIHWARARDRKRIKGVNAKAVQPFYAAIPSLYCQHRYPPSAIFNMDETGYAIGNVTKRCAMVYSGGKARNVTVEPRLPGTTQNVRPGTATGARLG
jgi:hypothetical protein